LTARSFRCRSARSPSSAAHRCRCKFMRYQGDLKRARNDTSREFYAANEAYSRLIDLICESTFSQALEIQNEVTLTKYQHALLASFVRSTVISVELIVKSELVEAVTILRKQVELLARLYELENKEFESLSGKTPILFAGPGSAVGERRWSCGLGGCDGSASPPGVVRPGGRRRHSRRRNTHCPGRSADR